MITLKEIKTAAYKAKEKIPIRSMSLFGSYANGTANNNSDVDILVEINKEHPSLFDAGAIQYYMQDMLDLKVDVIIYPLKEGTRFKIGKTVRLI
jgi:predicted nucleotidyltransferase